jgi:predicted nucleic acid-binding protein
VPEAISNTSPLLYLYRIGHLEWLRNLFTEVWVPDAVVMELREGQRRGYEVPQPENLEWMKVVEPASLPSEWLSLDLGPGELAALALALEHPERVVLLDDSLARRIGQAAGLTVWGTLKVLLEAKAQGWTDSIASNLEELQASGMWLSEEIKQRVLALAGEGIQA